MDLSNVGHSQPQAQQVTEELLLSLTECKSLSEISVLSLRNKQLTTCMKVLSQCVNLMIAYLQHNRIQLFDMQKHLGHFQSLQKIDLSFNQIKRLPDGQCFSQLRNLKVLYLHDNLIANWEDLEHLQSA
jgi:Leucine-rich repeat (LRR) protein